MVLVPDARCQYAGMERVRCDNRLESPRQLEGEKHVGQLRVGVGLQATVSALAAYDRLQRRAVQLPRPMRSRAHVHHASGGGPEAVDEKVREQEVGEMVHRHRALEPVLGELEAVAVHASVIYEDIEPVELGAQLLAELSDLSE